jgi:S-(hydroxymethyl)glutathione dehydrogenase/alcohol dehydrogenase
VVWEAAVKTTAAILAQCGAPLEIESGIDIPSLGPGQLLVRIAYSGVCRSQVMETRGLRGADPYLPHMLGHEGSGEVVEIGPGVTKLKVGDPVILSWIRGSGLDAPRTVYQSGGRAINAGAITTFARLAVISENRCTRCPDGLPLDVAALLGCAVLTGNGLIEHEAMPEPGAAVAIFGLGGVGMSALMAAARRSPSALIAVDVDPGKLRIAEGLGATVAINALEQDPVAAMRRLTDGLGPDVVIEAAGRGATIARAFEAVRRGGVCVFASHPAAGEMIQLDPYELIAGKRIRGSWGGGARPDEDIPRLAELYARGELPIADLVNARYPLERVNQALDDLEAGRVLRPLLDMALQVSR